MANNSRKVVYGALIGNLLVAISKFAAAAWSGSSVMLSEGVHSLVDTSNQVLLLYGQYRADLPPDEKHPFGHGRELYFWSFIVALLLFALGAGVSFYQGISHIRNPNPIEQPIVNYIVLGCSAIFEFGSWAIAFKEFRKSTGKLDYYEAFVRSKDPPVFLVLFEDSAALIGLAIAFVGTFASVKLQIPILDGVASIGIAVVLGITAFMLARESKALLIGESAADPVNKSIRDIVGTVAGVVRVNRLATVHLAPDEVVVSLSIEFDDRLTVPDVELRIAEMERMLRKKHPEVIAVFVKPQSKEQSGEFRSGVGDKIW
jgi:cation diffusion facilitator family transporter